MEVWKEIKGYKPIYQVSNKGRVKSLCRETRCNKDAVMIRKERILKPSHVRKYLNVYLYDIQGKKRSVLLHRLVAQAFVPNYENLTEIDHIDGNPENNNAKNLRWVTHKENCNNPVTINRCKGRISKFRKPVVAYNLDGTIFNVFLSVEEAAKQTGAHRANIRKCIKGIYKTCANLIFKYQ